jgi:glycosyltransferase involved in cell wall biosynthesis
MSTPLASVVIPAYHSHSTLRECLLALRAQTFRDFEVLLVNSSQESQTARVVEDFPEVHFKQSPVRLFPHAARNLGVQQARGELLVFTDPDCQARPDWLERLIQSHQAGHSVVGGAMGFSGNASLEWAIHFSKFFWLLPELAEGKCRVVCTANASYNRAAWNAAGPFDGELFTGDALLAMRAADRGHTPWFEPNAVVDHTHEGAASMYARQFFLRGREFGEARAVQESWTQWRIAQHLLSGPLMPLQGLAKTGICAARSGRIPPYIRSFFYQFVFRVSWSLGEMAAEIHLLRRGAQSAVLSSSQNSTSPSKQ